MTHGTFLSMAFYGNPFYAALFANAQQPILIQATGQSDISSVVIPGESYDDDKESGLYLRIRGMEEDAVDFMMGRNANIKNLTSVGKVYLTPSSNPEVPAAAGRAVRKVAELVVGGATFADAVKRVNSPAISLTGERRKMSPPRTNPRAKRNPLASRQEQVRYLKDMVGKSYGRYPSHVGSEYGLYLAQHFVFGVMKKTPNTSLMTGLMEHKAQYAADGWTPDEHLALVALGLMQSHRLRDITQEYLMTEFLRYVGEMIGDENLSEMGIMYKITELGRLA